MEKRIVVTGATGLIGKRVIELLKEKNYSVTVFTRSPQKAKSILPRADEFVEWDSNNINWSESINGAYGIIHLAGESVIGKRWSPQQKQKIKESRIEGTGALIKAVSKVENKPEVFISASAVGYYGTSFTKEFTEESEPGNDFLAEVASAWENEAEKVEKLDVRRVSIRIGIVLDKNEGALAKMITPFKFFIGGPLGSGNQPFPWVHLDDVAGLFIYALENKNLFGAYNAVAPEKLTMKEFTNRLGNVMKRPSIFSVPEFVLKIVLGEAAEVVTKGAFVIPKRTLESGYNFKFTKVNNALKDLLN